MYLVTVMGQRTLIRAFHDIWLWSLTIVWTVNCYGRGEVDSSSFFITIPNDDVRV